MQEVRVDEMLLLVFVNVDIDYAPHPFEVYLEKNTGKLFQIFERSTVARREMGPACAVDHRKMKRIIREHPSDYLRLNLSDHGDRHKWFRAFLASIKRGDTYFGSIGGWFKEYGDDETREEWREFERQKLIEEVVAEAERDGVKIVLT